MFTEAKLPKLLESETERLLLDLERLPINSEDYKKTLDLLIQVHKMKAIETPSPVSKDTLLVVGANILGILLIIRHEHVNVVTSKAMNMVIKPRSPQI